MKPITTLATCLTPEGVPLTLIHHDRDHYLMLGGNQLMSTDACNSEQHMAELACANLPAKARVLIGGLGFGFTLRRVLQVTAADAFIHVAELLPEIIRWNREFLSGVNGLLLDEPRVSVKLQDVYDLMDGKPANRYHAILLDVDNSPDPLVQQGNARLYARAGLRRVREALQPGGRVIFWSANRDEAFARALRGIFRTVGCIAVKAYPKAKRFSHTLFVADRD
jgi:spermidine synthase